MTKEWKDSVGERLLELRSQKRMTQEDLAEYLNVSRQSVSKWELNKALPDVEKLMQLSGLYEVTLDYIVTGKEIPKNVTEESALVHTESVFEQQDTESSVPHFENMAYRMIFLVAMLVAGILTICAFVFSFCQLSDYSFGVKDKEQDVAIVDKIYEQYTLADVTIWDDEMNYHSEKVWLDNPGVREGDVLSYYYTAKERMDAMFHYYDKTILVPFIVSVTLLIFTIIFGIGFYNYGGKRKNAGE